MLDIDDYLEQDKLCKYCGNVYKRGEFIWLEGEELCPRCYEEKSQLYHNYYELGYRTGYEKGYESANENKNDEVYFS